MHQTEGVLKASVCRIQCYRVIGPATVFKSVDQYNNNILEACLSKGGSLEMFHPQGKIVITQDTMQVMKVFVGFCRQDF